MTEGGSLIGRKREEFHAGLIASGTLTVDADGVASIADKGNRVSMAIGRDIAEALKVETEQERRAGQSLGNDFEAATLGYVSETFPAFGMLRPGRWEVRKVPTSRGNKKKQVIPEYEPYSHLADLAQAVEESPSLAAMLANSYEISPDIVVARAPEADELINADEVLVDEVTAMRASIRSAVQPLWILHAIVSCKWTLRSDRAQNARSEALNLIRNRKGRLPHIVVVTAEPLPSRLASLALGTGDLDCVYHVALPELVAAVERHGNDDTMEALQIMVEGKRLKDISDLPLDLTV